MDDYCEKAGFASTARFCFTRTEGDSQATACDYLAVGKLRRDGPLGAHVELQRQALHRRRGRGRLQPTTRTTSSW